MKVKRRNPDKSLRAFDREKKEGKRVGIIHKFRHDYAREMQVYFYDVHAGAELQR